MIRKYRIIQTRRKIMGARMSVLENVGEPIKLKNCEWQEGGERRGMEGDVVIQNAIGCKMSGRVPGEGADGVVPTLLTGKVT